jgi:hypothetical protein
MVDVANFLSVIDIDPNRCHWSLLSLRFPQCRSFDESYSGMHRAALASFQYERASMALDFPPP